MENSLTHIASAATTQVFEGTGVLDYITVNTTAAGTITIYDEIGSATTTVIGILPSNAVVGTYIYKGTCAKGLKIITGAASDITVSWRKG